MKEKNVSVIIPVYNQNSSLNITLNFFNKQTYDNSLFEIIVVDDGSDYSAEKYIKERNSKFNYSLKFIRQNNQGRANARNTAINNAQGEILLFNDADRFPHHDLISKHMEHFIEDNNSTNKVVIGCSYDYFGSYNQPEKILNLSMLEIHRMARKPVFYSKIIQLYDEANYTESEIRWISYLVGNSSIKKADIEKVGGFDDYFSIWGAEHFDLAIRMVRQNYQFYLCEGAINYHIPHKREANFYKSNIEKSVELLVQKYNDKKYYFLKDFLFGEISLQELEKQFTDSISRVLLEKADFLNIIH
jgi:glycosyltransferase involved in cell wall biosynthesis